ncbi:MAG TPA: hemerythrin domain-containing protein [Planctomycetota bacterium]|jgi:hemerythrin-like domain-containing protein
MRQTYEGGRRDFLSAGLGAGLVILSGCGKDDGAHADDKKGKEADVTAAEDLMREHGVLRRIFVIYEEIMRRIETDNETPPHTLSVAAATVRSFVEDYHEKMEEELIFPVLRKADKHVQVLDVLINQHAVGRKLTDTITRLSEPLPSELADRTLLSNTMREFMRMYRPHAAREDTIIFPELHHVLSAKEYDALGDVMEEREKKLFGDKGFEETVVKIQEVERNLGVLDLATFTPGT